MDVTSYAMIMDLLPPSEQIRVYAKLRASGVWRGLYEKLHAAHCAWFDGRGETVPQLCESVERL